MSTPSLARSPTHSLIVFEAYRTPIASKAANINPDTSPGVLVKERETAQGSIIVAPTAHKKPTSKSVGNAAEHSLASVELKRRRGCSERAAGDVRRPRMTRTLRSHKVTPAQRKPKN
jgi:hypothetical protein